MPNEGKVVFVFEWWWGGGSGICRAENMWKLWLVNLAVTARFREETARATSNSSHSKVQGMDSKTVRVKGKGLRQSQHGAEFRQEEWRATDNSSHNKVQGIDIKQQGWSVTGISSHSKVQDILYIHQGFQQKQGEDWRVKSVTMSCRCNRVDFFVFFLVSRNTKIYETRHCFAVFRSFRETKKNVSFRSFAYFHLNFVPSLRISNLLF